MSDTDRPTKRETAFHEAGHVVVGWLEGAQIISATIVSDGRKLGRVSIGSIKVDAARAAFRDGGPGQAWALRLLSREVRICLSGYAAENLASGRRGLAPSHDERRARRYASRLLDDDVAADDVLTYEWPQVVRHLRARWAFVEKVAQALLDEQALDAARISRLLDGVPRLKRTHMRGLERLLTGRSACLISTAAPLGAKEHSSLNQIEQPKSSAGLHAAPSTSNLGFGAPCC